MARQFSKSFYRSREWEEVRAYILKRDNYLCVKCGAPAEEVHHIIHLSPDNIGDPKISMAPNNLASLCRACHFAEHKAEKIRGVINSQKSKDCDDGFVFDENGFLVRVNNS